ncbi:MAG: lipopolysaccharide heptosyltransferase II, partial [Caldilineaceae bacterium]|nr:lipopolysaccharide heptosyltransferase II [Caldilineaceae bacterium]
MRILIVGPAWVGDMVMSHALVQVLGQRHPEAEVHVLAPPATAPVARRMPGVARVWELAVGHGELGLRRRWRLARALRDARFAQAIVVPNSFKSALVPWLARIPARIGWHGEQRYGVLTDRRRLDPLRTPLQVQRFAALGVSARETLPEPLPVPRLRADEARGREIAAALKLRTDGPIAVLCPGAEYGPAKRWPEAHFARIAQHLRENGAHVWLMGSAGDAAVCDRICALGGGDVANLAGRTSLAEAIDLLSLADRVVCNDSGLMHVAAALGRRVTAIFGSTSDAFTPPLSA